ncbi:MAG: hypothetical protein ACYCO9_09735 [Streptosporangiaceae bacterium]
MTRTRVAAVIFAGATLLGVGGGSAALASAGQPARPARYMVLNCSNKLVVAPRALTMACADAGDGLQRLHWTSWTSHMATAYGTFYENNCKPSCANGHIYDYPSRAVLWGSAAVKGHPGWRRYTRLTLIFTGKVRPPVYVRRNGKIVTIRPLTQTFPAI